MKRMITALAAFVCLATFKAAPVAAMQNQGFYAGAFGGANWLQVSKHKGHGSHQGGNKLEFDVGYALGGFGGYKFCGGFRVEGEISYRYNKLKKVKFGCDNIDFASASDVDVDCNGSYRSYSSGSYGSYDSYGSGSHHKNKGHLKAWSYMVNAYYDIPAGWDCYSILPYIGFGLGYSQQKLKTPHICEAKKNGFAWQVMLGLDYVIDCNMDVALEYRFHKGKAEHFYNHDLLLVGKYHF